MPRKIAPSKLYICMYNVFLTSIDSKLRQSVWRENLYVEDFEAREGVRPLPSQERKELYVKKKNAVDKQEYV